MKAEEFGQKCPQCGCADKSLSEVKDPKDTQKLQEAGITGKLQSSATIGSIRCSECGYLFEYCKDRKFASKVKRICID